MVTCGGLCPGLNDVIRSLFFELHHAYGVKEVLGFRWGYQGLDPDHGAERLFLTPELVDGIHLQGGTILGTSRGPVDGAIMLRIRETSDRSVAALVYPTPAQSLLRAAVRL